MTNMTSAIPPDKYWIGLPAEQLGPAVRERFDKYLDELEERGRMNLYRLAARRYYGSSHFGGSGSSAVSFGGEQGEVAEITVNQYGSIITSLLSLATSSRPAWQTTAKDDKAQSLASVELCDQILEYELRRGAEMELIDATRRMLLFQEGAIGVFWHPEEGDPVAVEDVPAPPQQPMMPQMGGPAMLGAPMPPSGMQAPPPPMQQKGLPSGELRVEALSPYDVARDMRCRSVRDVPWVIVRRRFNKWDLAALYPEHAQDIIGAETVTSEDRKRGLHKNSSAERSSTDTVYALELYAMRTPACPNGRYARIVGSTALETGDLQYERLPVALHSPERTVDEATGSSRTIDLLGPQQAYDSVVSNLLSNNDAFGRGNIVVADGADLDVSDLGGGLQEVKYKPVEGANEPHAMDLPRISTADMSFAEMLASVMQVLSGVNSVVRGDPEESLKSGAALALVQAMAVQHNSGLQRAVAEAIEALGTRILETYRRFVTAPRVIEITGTNETRVAKEFVGGDLDGVMSVRVEIGNPMLRTLAGKKELADFYADPQRWMLDGPLTQREHLAFMTTGRLPMITAGPRAAALAVREENEALAQGQPTVVLDTDHHELHIKEHAAMVNGRNRMELDPMIVKAIGEHIAGHGAAWVRLSIENPALLMATGQKPAPMPMMPAAPPGGPGAPANDNGAAPAANDNGQAPGAQAPPGAPPMPGGGPNGEAPPANMPSMPTDPSTGQRVQMPGGMQ